MKLDYLQFLELEVFTRFGARLEPGMEARIRRGRVLREILKQDRLSPESAEFQLAWLTALNTGLFDPMPLERVPQCLTELRNKVAVSSLGLDSGHEEWAAAVRAWLPPSSGAAA